MRAMRVEEGDVDAKGALQAAQATENEVVEAFPGDTLDPPLRMGVGIGRTERCLHNAHGGPSQNRVEVPGEERVPIVYDDARGDLPILSA